MNSSQFSSWVIESLPFVWGAQDTPHNPGCLPDTLPFTLAIDKRSGLLVQMPNKQVEQALERAYELGSVMGSNVAEGGVGRQYADDFLEFIFRSIEACSLDKKSLLEIGCGNGYLLSRLCGVFDTTIGVEPGPQGKIGGDQYGVNVIQDFFPSPKITGKYSAIVLMSVLEHVQDPIGFTHSLMEYLEPEGRIFISVPNEGAYIQNGDVSTLFHEHWSYFDQKSLRMTMALAGLTLEREFESTFGGSLYACLAAGSASKTAEAKELAENISVAEHYLSTAQDNCVLLKMACERMVSNGKTLGVYVPARFVNAVGIANISTEKIRFFDDDPGLVGTFYPGISVKVESRNDLLESPTDSVLVMSRTFGGQLAHELKEMLPAEIVVLTVADLLF